MYFYCFMPDAARRERISRIRFLAGLFVTLFVSTFYE